MGINYPTISQDVNFVGNFNNGFHPNQGFIAGWNKPSFPFDNLQEGGMGRTSIKVNLLSRILFGIS
jgi:hypothetical protein